MDTLNSSATDSSATVSNSNVEELLKLLAVVGSVSLATMTTLFGATLSPSLWRELACQPGVIASVPSSVTPDLTYAAGELAMLPALAEQRLRVLEQNDRLGYRQLHQNALDILAVQLPAGGNGVEERLISIFKRLADHLLGNGKGAFKHWLPRLNCGPANWKAACCGGNTIRA